MEKIGLEITGAPEGKAAAYYDKLIKQFPRRTAKIRNRERKIETGWEITGFDSQKMEVSLTKKDKNDAIQNEFIPLAEFLALQQE